MISGCVRLLIRIARLLLRSGHEGPAASYRMPEPLPFRYNHISVVSGASVDAVNTFLLCLGYTCTCGERVTVFELPVNSGKQVALSTKTVSCRKWTFTNRDRRSARHIGSLDRRR